MKCEVCSKGHSNKRFCSIGCRNSVIQKIALQAKRDKAISIICALCAKVFKPGSRARKYCSRECYYKSETVNRSSICKHCGEVFDQIRSTGLKTRRIFCTRSCASKNLALTRTYARWSIQRREIQMKSVRRGADHPNWRGGITPMQKQERRKPEYITWRKQVFDRDDYTCQICFQRGGNIQADHIKSWVKYPELRTDIDNGRTLCVPCHKLTPTYARNLRYQA